MQPYHHLCPTNVSFHCIYRRYSSDFNVSCALMTPQLSHRVVLSALVQLCEKLIITGVAAALTEHFMLQILISTGKDSPK